MNQEEFQLVQSSIPAEPGIYKYFDEEHTLIYVGKAKHLRKRVSSYFNKNQNSYKTNELVRRIRSIEFTIVNSEQDAFLLENSLIKEFQPRYNINLKDDKSYPYIVIKKEDFPRVFLTRRVIRDGSEYLGPFTSVGKVRELIHFTRQHIPLRTCKLNLTPQNIEKKKFKVCLEYHLGNCKGPCEGLQTPADYAENLQRLRSLLKGNLSPVLQVYKDQMMQYVEQLSFEKAEILKKKIEHLRAYQAKSTIVNQKMGDIDVFAIAVVEDDAYVNFLMVRNGTIVDTQTITLKKKLDESAGELLSFAVNHFRETFRSTAPEIVVPFPVEYPDEQVKQIIPKSGDKKNLIELSIKNVDYFIQELQKRKRLHLQEAGEDKMEILEQLQDDLSLMETPVHIECFDNSNFQGSYPVSAMVCFKDGVPSKKDYRHFNVKTVQGINDFATMKEVVFRRYKRLMESNESLPQLVIIDGGKGQLGAAMESIEDLGLTGRMTLVGLAKNEEEIFFAGDKDSLKLPFDGQSLRLIRYIRDEVHRFGITFHRKKRSGGTFKNQLEDIKGIGNSTADTLLKHFRSVKNVTLATMEEITNVVGKQKAQIVYTYFHPDDEGNSEKEAVSTNDD
ncbi:excinuclease ABC subunit UvrC [Pollutibacter soli]|uniref:excinuclease ABC subunit UvrC n=1 Tax=Pollutibacter soli TaxID=3034157 RepID=UPI00301325C5